MGRRLEFRHQLEADIEPFRGLLLGLFFIAVGMSIDFKNVASNWMVVTGAVVALMMIKASIIYGLSRLFGSGNRDAQRIAVTIPQGGEFAFVLFSAAMVVQVMSVEITNLLTAVVGISMALTPIVEIAHRRIHQSLSGSRGLDALEGPENAALKDVIVVGFGRVGQIVTQLLNARGIEVIAVDDDP